MRAVRPLAAGRAQDTLRGTMVQAALPAPVIPGRAQWQGAAGPAQLPRFVVSRLAAAIWAAVGAALGVWGFLGGAAFQLNPAFWTMVVIFALMPLVSGISQLLIDRPVPVERYTLTERFFVVQSERGCHAYDLATLNDLTVDVQGGHGRILLRRQPNVSRELRLVMRFTAWANNKETDLRVVLADRLDDAPELLRRIRAAQETLPKAPPSKASPTKASPVEAPPVEDSLTEVWPVEPSRTEASPPVEGVSTVATDIPQAIPYEWGNLLGGLMLGTVSLATVGTFSFSGAPLIGLPLLLIFAVVGCYLWNSLRVRERRLLRSGTWVMGEITEVRQTDSHADDWRVRFRYPIPGGATVSAELGPSTFAAIERWGVGDLIEVRYDPAHPERHLVRSYA
jgi:Protein of unknown function (DUF3592)